MIEPKKEPFSTILSLAKKRNISIYLVGGYIRDLILNKKSKDIDFCISCSPVSFGRDVANKLGGSFVLLDENTTRVVLGDLSLDFSILEGNLEEDLRRRDFTINSLAYDFSSKKIIDYLGGLFDINNGLIRGTKENLIKDPIRLLRAVRFASSLSFKIENKTKGHILELSHLITSSAPERITFELFEILKNKNASKFLKDSFELGILSNIFPEIVGLSQIEGRGYHHLNLIEHSFETIAQIEGIYNNLDALFPKYSSRIKLYLDENIASDHPRYSILKLIGLFHDLGKPETMREEGGKLRFIGHEKLGSCQIEKIGKRIRLSQKETSSMKNIVLNHMRIGTLIQGGIITRKAIFRLAKDLEDDLIMLLILSLADRYSAVGEATTEEDIRKHEDGTKTILSFVFDRTEVIKPPKIVSGKEIMERFGLSSGPLIGKLLLLIEEGFIEGKVKNKDDAFSIVREYLSTLKNPPKEQIFYEQ